MIGLKIPISGRLRPGKFLVQSISVRLMVQQSTYIELDAGEAASLFRTKKCLLRCVRGKIWVTEDNGDGDIVLTAGDVHRLTRRGLTVVQSVERRRGATCQLIPDQISCRRLEALRTWVFALSSQLIWQRVRLMLRTQRAVADKH